MNSSDVSIDGECFDPHISSIEAVEERAEGRPRTEEDVELKTDERT